MQPKYKVWDNVEFKLLWFLQNWIIRKVYTLRFIWIVGYSYDIQYIFGNKKSIEDIVEEDIYWIIK